MKIRETARLLVLDPDKRLLLIKFEVPYVSDGSGARKEPFWATVGGQIEEGESFRAALIRELEEETGFGVEDANITDCIWYGEHELNWSEEKILFRERFAVAYVKSSTLKQNKLTAEEKQVIKSFKWWTLEELKNSSEIIYPPNLAVLLGPLLNGKAPSRPVEIEL